MQEISQQYDMNYLIAIFCCSVLTYFTFKLFEMYFLYSKCMSLDIIANETQELNNLIKSYMDDNESEDESDEEVETKEEENEEEKKNVKNEVKTFDEKDKVE